MAYRRRGKILKKYITEQEDTNGTEKEKGK